MSYVSVAQKISYQAANFGNQDMLNYLRELGCPWDECTCALARQRPRGSPKVVKGERLPMRCPELRQRGGTWADQDTAVVPGQRLPLGYGELYQGCCARAQRDTGVVPEQLVPL